VHPTVGILFAFVVSAPPGGETVLPVEWVDEEPPASSQEVAGEGEIPRIAPSAGASGDQDRADAEESKKKPPASAGEDKSDALPIERDPKLRPFSKPLSVVGVVLEPIKEANLLLPERIDPFGGKTLAGEAPVEVDPESADEYIARLKKQRELLGTSTLFSTDPSKLTDVAWHFQVQMGGSFRAGNNTAANVNTQGRAERHSLRSDLMARLQAFYTQVEQGTPNRRVFGEGNYDRNLRGRWICYVREELEYDEARLINLRTLTSGGVGFRFIDSIYERLVARTGPTMSYVDYASPGSSEDELRSGWLIEGDYRRVLGEASRLELTSTAFPDFDTDQAFRIRTEGAVLFPIGRTSAWSWKVGVRHEYIMNPVVTTQPNDVEGYFSIVYAK
jgi:hypothetical protein